MVEKDRKDRHRAQVGIWPFRRLHTLEPLLKKKAQLLATSPRNQQQPARSYQTKTQEQKVQPISPETSLQVDFLAVAKAGSESRFVCLSSRQTQTPSTASFAL